MPATTPAHLLLVHGSWHASWCWERLIPELTATGWHVHTVDLPTSSPRAGEYGMQDDAKAIRAALAKLDGPVVVLAHSYGGIPATEAVSGAGNVARLIYLSAFLLEVGESLLSRPPGEPGELMPPPEDPHQYLYGDLTEEQARWAIDRLSPQSLRAVTDAQTTAGWRTVPTTYVICEKDQALAVADQRRMAARAGTILALPTGHSPFLSAPAELAALIEEYAAPGTAHNG